jgi:hypothetical protein
VITFVSKPSFSPIIKVLLVALMAVVMASEMQWLALAPISRVVASYYNLNTTSNSFVGPDLLTLIHLVAFVVVSIPISWVVTKVGLKRVQLLDLLLGIQ